MEKKIFNIINNGDIALVFGPTGIGKTRLAKKIMSLSKIPYWHIMCPLEICEWNSIIYSLNNNPKQLLVIDNIDEAEKSIISKIIVLIKNKKKSTKIIINAINPYARELSNTRKLCVLYQMPTPSKDALLKKAAKTCNNETMHMLSNIELTDFRLFKNIIKYSSEPINSQTYLGLKNPFKAFDWLLGCKNTANLEEIVESNPDFYINGIHTNYIKKSKNICVLEKMATHLSDVDMLGYSLESTRATALTAAAWPKNAIIARSKIAFPRWVASKPSRPQREKENNETLAYIFKYYNAKSKKPGIKDMNYLTNLVKSYKISEKDCTAFLAARPCLTSSARVKAFIKKLLY